MVEKISRLINSDHPRNDESFIGYLLRLKELNFYDSLSWILQISGIQDYVHSNYSFVKGSLDLAPLAQLAGVEVSSLAALTYSPLRISKQRMMGDYSVFGSSIPHYLIQIRKPKICSICLQEDNYARKIWEIAPVTACPFHRCMLIDECPSCTNHITWSREGVSICRCQADWREHEVSPVDEVELEAVRRIFFLCNLPAGEYNSNALKGSPLYRLNLRQLISALTFIASQLATAAIKKGQPKIDTKGKHFFPSRRNASIHELLCKAVQVFHNWPVNFYSFLDMRSEQKRVTGQSARFMEYKSALRMLSSAGCQFIGDAYAEYKNNKCSPRTAVVRDRVDTSPTREISEYAVTIRESEDAFTHPKCEVAKIKQTSERASRPPGTRTITKFRPKPRLSGGGTTVLDEQQAAKILGVGVETVRHLAERGALKTHKRLPQQQQEEGRYYFSSYIINKYQTSSDDRNGLIAFLSAAKLFKLWPNNFYNRFIKTSRLKPVVENGRRSEHFFKVEDVQDLLRLEQQTIITSEVAEILCVNTSCVDKLVASKVLKPMSGPSIDGFGKNLFLRSEVKQLHAERQAFKARRLGEGRSDRFGRQPEPRAQPVIDVIGPRIDQLITEWRLETQGHVSGPKLHRQLLNEGVQVGIVSVYKYLRQIKAPQAVPP